MSSPTNARTPAANVPGRFLILYSVAYAALWLALLTPAIITIALRVRQLAPVDATRSTSMVLMAGALVALVSNPVFGALSDGTRSRFGRRRPWLIGGIVGGCASLAYIGIAPSVGAVLAGWCLAQLCFNAVLSAMVALIPDYVPPRQRGTVVGTLGICMPIGQIAGTFLVQQLSSNMMLALMLPALIGLAGVLALAMGLPDSGGAVAEDSRSEPAEVATIPPSQPDATSASGEAASSRLDRRHDFTLAWLSRVFYTTGSCFLQAYQPFFLLESLHQPIADIPALIFRSTLLQAAMVVLWSLLAGYLSDRSGRRKAFVMAGAAIQGAGLWVIAAAHSYEFMLLGVALVGIGHGVYEGVDLALVTDVLPDRARHAARDLGLLNIANTLPQVVAPLAAPAILAASPGNFSLLFVIAGAVAAAGSVFLAPLRNVR